MVFVPTRGDQPVRFSPEVPRIPDIGPSVLDASVYTDPARFELERRYILNRSWQIIGRSSQIPATGDHLVWEGHGETIVVTRRRDGGLAGFHNICQHRGARIVRDSGCGARRFKCPFHDWVYDYEGTVIGVPDREDFDPNVMKGLAAPAVELDEWGGWIWAVLDGPGVAPPLREWLGDEIAGDLGAYRMEDMILKEKIVWDVDVNWKVVIDAFNEFYHAQALHNIPVQDAKDGRESRILTFERHAMMIVPFKGVLPTLQQTQDHQSVAICHYTLFPTAVFNNNPEHIQLFRAVPITHNRTRFETWELWYDTDDADYLERTGRHWERLKYVVSEDVWTWEDVAATSRSTKYTRNILNDHECKITFFHDLCQRMIDEGVARDAEAGR
jgi:phenylpropionate dioxygenase-like ring-hydroxylating dioxygenase large terminal subunit